MARRTVTVVLVLLALGVCVGCLHRSPGMRYKSNEEPLTEGQVLLGSEMKADIEHLAGSIGPRSGAHSLDKVIAAEDWIAGRLRESGLEPVRDVVDLAGVEVANLEVTFEGAERPDEIIVIGGHYDTVADSPGANDNASGVALLLAVAQRLRETPLSRTVKLLFFVNEEDPFTGGIQMGSRVYADRCKEREDDIVLMVSIDSIGYYTDEAGSQDFPALLRPLFPSSGNFVSFISNKNSKNLLDRVVSIFQEHARFPTVGVATDSKQINRSDHTAFVWRGYPALLMSDTAAGRDPNYHLPTDTPDQLNYDALARVADGLVKTLRTLASSDTVLP